MSTELRIFVCKKEQVKETGYTDLTPIAAFDLVRNKELHYVLEELAKESGSAIRNPLFIDFEEQETKRDKYNDVIRYVSCKKISDTIIHYYNEHPDEFSFPYNQCVASYLSQVDERCYALLYWR